MYNIIKRRLIEKHTSRFPPDILAVTVQPNGALRCPSKIWWILWYAICLNFETATLPNRKSICRPEFLARIHQCQMSKGSYRMLLLSLKQIECYLEFQIIVFDTALNDWHAHKMSDIELFTSRQYYQIHTTSWRANCFSCGSSDFNRTMFALLWYFDLCLRFALDTFFGRAFWANYDGVECSGIAI